MLTVSIIVSNCYEINNSQHPYEKISGKFLISCVSGLAQLHRQAAASNDCASRGADILRSLL